MKQTKQHAQALAEQAHFLYSQGKQAEAVANAWTAKMEAKRAMRRMAFGTPAY